ncbi:MAG: nitrilase-related carbon-nitrogen hydrolase [Verrucomicrobiota bacterium]
MAALILDLHTFDVGAPATSPAEYAELVIRRTLESWRSGADIVVFPEFTWMGLERFIPGPDKLAGVASLFWQEIWPHLGESLAHPDKAVVLGTVPFSDSDCTLRNRAPILSEGGILHQDKIHLTPWESVFTGGGPLRIWNFRGRKLAVVICLDVEIPEISAALRGSGLDLMLVPSATENLLGVERVARCADARAVELGCYVGICHLVGKTASELIDENIGRLSCYSPSQSPFQAIRRQDDSVVHQDGFHQRTFRLDLDALEKSRVLRSETDPSKIRPASAGIEIIHS